jgi:hypothetical protein
VVYARNLVLIYRHRDAQSGTAEEASPDRA